MSFELDLAKFADELEVETEQVVRKVALDVHTKVSMKTPVDTGRARANWNVSAGSPDRSVTEDTSAQVPTLKKGDGEEAIYITNSLPYIGKLEDGSSDQAPSGMVSITMAEVEAGIKNVIR